MKKSLLVAFSTFLIGLVVGCQKNLTTTMTNSIISSTPTSIITTLPSTTQTTTSLSTLPLETTTLNTTTLTTTTTIFNSLSTVELPIHSTYYGNTNGNALNQGLAVYDKTNARHIYAVGPSVYTFNPATNETEILFTLSSGGSVRNLCLSASYLYFVDSNDYWMFKYDFTTEAITSVYEGETYYLSRYDDSVFVDRLITSYTTYRGVSLFYDDDQTFYSSSSPDSDLINISGTKLYYHPLDTAKISVMDRTFIGKSTVIDLATFGLINMDELLLISSYWDSVLRFALIGETSSSKSLYLYDSESGLSELMGFTGSDLHSINFDGENLYYINAGQLYRYQCETQINELVISLPQDAHYLLIINHWIYVSISDLSHLYRIHPDTHEIESLT